MCNLKKIDLEFLLHSTFQYHKLQRLLREALCCQLGVEITWSFSLSKNNRKSKFFLSPTTDEKIRGCGIWKVRIAVSQQLRRVAVQAAHIFTYTHPLIELDSLFFCETKKERESTYNMKNTANYSIPFQGAPQGNARIVFISHVKKPSYGELEWVFCPSAQHREAVEMAGLTQAWILKYSTTLPPTTRWMNRPVPTISAHILNM